MLTYLGCTHDFLDVGLAELFALGLEGDDVVGPGAPLGLLHVVPVGDQAHDEGEDVHHVHEAQHVARVLAQHRHRQNAMLGQQAD